MYCLEKTELWLWIENIGSNQEVCSNPLASLHPVPPPLIGQVEDREEDTTSANVKSFGKDEDGDAAAKFHTVVQENAGAMPAGSSSSMVAAKPVPRRVPKKKSAAEKSEEEKMELEKKAQLKKLHVSLVSEVTATRDLISKAECNLRRGWLACLIPLMEAWRPWRRNPWSSWIWLENQLRMMHWSSSSRGWTLVLPY